VVLALTFVGATVMGGLLMAAPLLLWPRSPLVQFWGTFVALAVYLPCLL
jgi:hypothetical protein